MDMMTVREATRSFVGRSAELATLTESLDAGARVLYLHGIAGIGKSALLRAFLERVRDADASVVQLDCRTVEPTERGFLAAAGPSDDVDAPPARAWLSPGVPRPRGDDGTSSWSRPTSWPVTSRAVEPTWVSSRACPRQAALGKHHARPSIGSQTIGSSTHG
jgi:AAA ATPase-like protein